MVVLVNDTKKSLINTKARIEISEKIESDNEQNETHQILLDQIFQINKI
jgi:hypothetical protein